MRTLQEVIQTDAQIKEMKNIHPSRMEKFSKYQYLSYLDNNVRYV